MLRRLRAPFFFVLLLSTLAKAQTSPSTGSEVVERVSPSVVLILTRVSGGAEGYASGLIVRDDGVLLTTNHAIKDATAVQVRLKNGEIFDNVQLVGRDERRDIAALRIPGAGLPAAPVRSSEIRAGEEVYVISNPAGLAWTTSAGIISGVRLADEVAGAGKGYRLVQFTAPVSPGSSGGVLVDKQGMALGIIVGTLNGGQSLNFAVPIESVLGLAQMSGGSAFGSGSGLQVRQERPLPGEQPRPAPARQGGAGFEPPVQPVNPDATELSSPIQSRDPVEILRKFRTIFILSKSVWIRQELMQEAMQKQLAGKPWGITIVSDSRVADLRLTVNRVLFTWTWTYELVHQNSGIVLLSGKMDKITGGVAGDQIAEAIVKKISAARGTPAEVTQPPQKP